MLGNFTGGSQRVKIHQGTPFEHLEYTIRLETSNTRVASFKSRPEAETQYTVAYFQPGSEIWILRFIVSTILQQGLNLCLETLLH